MDLDLHAHFSAREAAARSTLADLAASSTSHDLTAHAGSVAGWQAALVVLEQDRLTGPLGRDGLFRAYQRLEGALLVARLTRGDDAFTRAVSDATGVAGQRYAKVLEDRLLEAERIGS